MTGGQIEVFPHIETKGLLHLKFRRGMVTVTAGKYIGLIPLTPHISIDVKPKLPVSNLAHVLDLARASLETLDKANRIYEVDASPGPTVLAFMLQNLVDALKPIRAQGLLKGYVKESQVSSQLRGHLNIAASLQACWSRGQRHKASVDNFEQTSDTPPNRLIKHALEFALNVFAHGGCEAKLLKQANEVHRELPGQVSRYRYADYGACLAIVRGQRLPPARAYYYRALEIALLILSQRAILLDRLGSDVELQTFILDFEAVFESYLRRVLEVHRPGHISVRNGNEEGKKALYDDRADVTAEPDIVLHSPHGAPVIAEVKYKEKPDRPDINQAITYAVSFRTEAIVLVHQSRTNGPHGLYTIGTVDGICLKAYGFNLAADNLSAEEEAFAKSLFTLTASQKTVPLVA